jgi:hypothetical protein
MSSHTRLKNVFAYWDPSLKPSHTRLKRYTAIADWGVCFSIFMCNCCSKFLCRFFSTGLVQSSEISVLTVFSPLVVKVANVANVGFDAFWITKKARPRLFARRQESRFPHVFFFRHVAPAVLWVASNKMIPPALQALFSRMISFLIFCFTSSHGNYSCILSFYLFSRHTSSRGMTRSLQRQPRHGGRFSTIRLAVPWWGLRTLCRTQSEASSLKVYSLNRYAARVF